MTSGDHPDTADWHASEEGQEERRQVATQDVDALNQFVDPFKASGLLDGVPGVKAVILGSSVGELEGATRDEARDAERARQHREGTTQCPGSEPTD